MEDPIEEAKLFQQIETNDKLETIGKNTEASLLVQSELKDSIEELKAPLDAIALNSEKPEVQKIEILGAELLTIKGAKGDKGDRGDDGKTPEKGKDYLTPEEIQEIKDATRNELKEEVTPVKGVDYFDGEDYVLTKEDKDEIVKSIDVPIVEKIIEKTETIIEKPITIDKTKTVVKEVAKYEEAEVIAEKLSRLSRAIDFKAIKNFPDFAKNGGNGIGYIREASDVSISSQLAVNDVLTWNGTSWVNESIGDTSAVWGNITGTITDQTDLVTYIDSKIATVDTLAEISALSDTTAKSLYQMTSGANVEFRASDTTTLTYWDDVNKRFGVGTATPETPFHAFGTTFPVGLIERQVTNTNSGGSAFGIRTTSTGNMTDGFGTGFTFQIEDNAGTANPIANIFASRNGADNTGKLVLNVYNAGSVVEALTVLNDGKVGIGTSSSIRSKFEVLGAGSNTVGISTSIIGLQSTANAAHQWGMRLGATSGELNLDSNFGGVDVNIVKFERGGNVGIGVSTVSAKLHVGGNTIISDSGTLLVGAVGSNLSVLSTTPRIQAITTSGIAISSVGVGDGTNNNRLGIYVDHTNREQGLAWTRSTGAIPFYFKDVSTNRGVIDINGNWGFGLGATATALGRIESRATSGAQAVFSYDASNRADFTVSSAGDLTITPTGGDINIGASVNLNGSNTPAINFGLNNTTANILSFDSTTATSQNVQLRLFRLTNTSGASTGLTIHSADGTAGVNAFIGAKGNTYFNNTTGNFGVGTAAPARKSTIVDTSDASLYIRRNTTTTGDYAEVLFQTSTSDLYATGIRSQRVASGFSDLLFLGQQTAGSVYATLYEMGRFTAPGNFGIGTGATVSAKLHVNAPGLMSTVSDTDGALRLGASSVTTAYLTAGLSTNGYPLLQGGRTSDSTAQALLLNPFGANVLIGHDGAGSARLHIRSTTEQARFDYDASNYGSFTVGSAGKLNISTTAEQVGINSSNAYTTLMVQKNAINSRVYYPLAIDASTQSQTVLGSGTGIIFGRSSGGNITGAIASYANGTTAGVGIWGTPSVTAGSNSVYSTSTPDFYVHSNGNVGIGTIAPLGKFEARSTSGAQAVFSYDSSNYVSFIATNMGALQVNTVANYIDFVDSSATFGSLDVSEVGLGYSTSGAGHEGIGIYHDGAEGFLSSAEGGVGWHNFTIQAQTLRLDLEGGTDNFVFSSSRFASALPIQLKGYTVATLPAGTQGDTAFVTDATVVVAKGVAPVAGGASVAVVFFNGSAWVGI